MAENLIIDSGTKESKYATLLPQINALITGEKNLIANLANTAAAINQTFDLLWVGFYLVDIDELVLGPFQGPIACTRIAYGKGVCGTAWQRKQIISVPDVDLFPGHIACSALSRSEIVAPILKNNEVVAVLDIDSAALNTFDHIDEKWLGQLCALLSSKF
jgi:GAF domain-containing protein